MTHPVRSVFVIVSPLGTGQLITTDPEVVEFWRAADAREVAAGRFGYDILEIPALVVHRSPKRPIE